MRVCIITYMLGNGGFTSSLLPVLKNLLEKNIIVDLMLFEESDRINEIPKDVNVIYNIDKINAIKKYLLFIMNPLYIYNAIVSCFNNKKNEIKNRYRKMRWHQNLVYLNSRCMPKKDMSNYDCVFAWEEVFASYYLSNNIISKNKIGHIHSEYNLAQFDKKTDVKGYKNLDKIICVSKGVKKQFDENLPKYKEKSITIYNLSNVKQIQEKSKEKLEVKKAELFTLVTVCRVENGSKAIDRLVRISNRLKKAGYDFEWIVVGDGPDFEYIKKLVSDFEVYDRVNLVGYKNNPYPYIKLADLFVLQSNYEGKPMAVEEAMILDVPVLITEYNSAYEQVVDEKTGFIVKNDEDEIYMKLKYILENKGILDKIKNNLKNEDKLKYENITDFLKLLQ